MTTKNILITGGAGFIGSHLVEKLITSEFNKIIIIDDLSTGSIGNVPQSSNIHFIHGKVEDVSLLDAVFGKYQFDFIYHLAAVASVQQTIDFPLESHKVNFDATLLLLERARKQTNLKKFIFCSSAAVYGDDPEIPKSEKTSAICPINPYGIDKYASEQYAVSYYKLYNVPASALRFFNVFGPRQNPKSPYSGVISLFMDEFLNSESPHISIYGNGEQTRDFVFVKDVVNAVINVSINDETNGKVFNVGTGISTSLNQLVKSLELLSGKTALVRYKEERAGDIKHSLSDISEIKKLGYWPEYNLESGLNYYYEEYTCE